MSLNMAGVCYRAMMLVSLVLASVSSASFLGGQLVADENPASEKNDAVNPDAAEQEANAKLIGTWVLEKAQDPGKPSGIGTRLKMFNGTHWCVLQPAADGKIVFMHGGTYEYDGTYFKTKTNFAGDRTATFIGNETTVKLTVEGDTLRQLDRNGVFTEIWRRVDKPGKT